MPRKYSRLGGGYPFDGSHAWGTVFTLTTLGGLALAAADEIVCGAAARNRGLVLLAFVAAAGRRGVSRDRLLAYFWPDSDQAHARNCLKQAVFAIRHGLDADPFVAGLSTFQIDTSVLSADSVRFEEALAARRLRAAAALYGGDYLDGVHVSGLCELECWMEAERTRLRYASQRALHGLAVEAEAAGCWPDAVHWWLKLAGLDPLGSRATMGLMRALVSVGERAEALEHGQMYQRRLREELDAEPDPEVRRLVQELRVQGSRVDRFAGALN